MIILHLNTITKIATNLKMKVIYNIIRKIFNINLSYYQESFLKLFLQHYLFMLLWKKKYLFLIKKLI